MNAWYVSKSPDYFPNGATVVREGHHEHGRVVCVVTETEDEHDNVIAIAALPKMVNALVMCVKYMEQEHKNHVCDPGCAESLDAIDYARHALSHAFHMRHDLSENEKLAAEMLSEARRLRHMAETTGDDHDQV